MADLLDFVAVRVLDLNGNPGAGYVARFYETGTTTPLTVYTDSGLGTAHGTSVTADSEGYLPAVWSSGASGVKCVIEDADGAVVKTVDPVFSHPETTSSASSISFAPTANVPSLDVQDAIELVDTNARTREAAISAAAQPLDATLTSLSGLSLVAGDILYATGADTLVRLPKGTARQLLRMNAGATAPEWVSRWPYVSSEQTITVNSTLTLAHGLGYQPEDFQLRIKCTTTDQGYSVGDELPVPTRWDDNSTMTGFQVVIDNGDTTNIKIIMGGALAVAHKTTYTRGAITTTSWRLIVRAR